MVTKCDRLKDRYPVEVVRSLGSDRGFDDSSVMGCRVTDVETVLGGDDD